MTSKGSKQNIHTKLSRQDKATLLDTYELTTSSFKNILIASVKQMYEKGTIQRINIAKSLIKLVQNNNMDEFDRRFATLENKENEIAAKKKAASIAQRIAEEEKTEETPSKPTKIVVRKETKKYIVRRKDMESEQPIFEVEFKNDYAIFYDAWKVGVVKLIKLASTRIQEIKNIKIVVGVSVIAKKMIEGIEIEREIHAHTDAQPIYNEESVGAIIRGKRDSVSKALDDALRRGSGWTIKRITALFITTYTQKPSRGSSYIPTPVALSNSKLGLINIKNDDHECFKYCMLYHQTDKNKNTDRLTVLRKVVDKYKWNGVNYPTTFEDITTFENLNKVCVNIYGISEMRKIDPIRLGSIQYVKNENINLLLIKDEHDNGHYLYIKKLESLLHTYTTNHYKDRSYCPYCRELIPKDVKYEDHVMNKHYDCHNNCNLCLPNSGSTMKFKNYKNMLERPFIVYCDFECSLIPIAKQVGQRETKTEMIAKHEPNSACAYFVCTFDNTRNKLYNFEGKNCVEKMIEQLRLLSNSCVEELRYNEDMILTKQDRTMHYKADKCYICGGGFSKINYKVKDHDHRTGQYRGAACNTCNVNYFTNRFLPCVFHNLRGYDSHLILRKAFDVVGADKIHAIPNSGEKFMTFSIGDLKFIDSFQFMTASLEKLSDSLKTIGIDPYEKFYNMKTHFSDDEMKLICRKGFYPYEFVDSHEKLNHPELPPKEAFYSKLKVDGVSDEDYAHAKTVYKEFNCKSFSDYHWLYLKTDVLLLSDVFENFRKTSLEHYKLDPANYLTSASLAWDAMMLKTKVELELISDPEILSMVEKSKRGGLTFVGAKRYAKANNQHMGENYDSTKESSYITYVDANNLYGEAMTQPLPHKNLKFETNITLKQILETSDNSETGYFVEADLDFPKELHKLFKQYPPCPESMVPNVEEFSDYQKEVMKKINGVTNKGELITPKTEKLIPHLHKHLDYVLHYKNLKFIHSLGVKITIKRVISFTQSPFMASYILDNNKLRKAAKDANNVFLVDFFKLMNNSVFGKTMECVRNRQNVHLTIDRENAIKWFSKLEFKSSNYVDGLYMIQTNKTKLVYDKPVYVGCAILDLSKHRMLDFHYNTIHKHFDGNYDLIYSDTDSLVYHIKHDNLLKWLSENGDEFDLSNMTGKWNSDVNNGVLGKMKSETGDKIITEFVGLSPKSYAYKYCSKEIKRAKGVSKSVCKQTMALKDYKEVMDDNTTQTRMIYGIQSFNQQLFSTCMKKVVLTSFYDKMKMVNEIDCVPFGFQA